MNSIQKAILKVFVDTPLSASDIAKQIDFPREKIYYHIKKLEAQKKIYIADTEIINGITKKKFLPIESETESVLPPPMTKPENQAKALKNDDADELKEQKQKDHQLDDSSSDIVSQVSSPSPQGSQAGTDSNVKSSLIQNLMKAKGVVPDAENEAQRTHPPDPSSPPETDIGRTIEKRRMSDDRRITGERRKESERRVEEKKESVGDEKRSGQERRKGKEKRVSVDRRKAIDRKQEAEKKKAKKPVLQSNWLYLYRLLSGYSKTVTFVQKGNRVNFLHATIKDRKSVV